MTDSVERNRLVIAEFRANQGRVGGPFAGIPILLLHTTHNSGAVWVHPLTYQPRGDAWVITATKSGAPTNPTWFDNLTSNPEVIIEVGADTFAGAAQILRGAERDRVWEEQKQANPRFTMYEQMTTREIPVIILTRA